ncbi:MAG: hypothetical protein Q7T17_09465 [Microbacterium sp.]|uniref:hypothetical protein n=1 Tax=Microbacterium sp. TaxID=51671 RepID=UPI002722E122|nr:hypothetical protein [Microbacterium sp.]MDO8383191.1 hypothetical protein [Microbacterium sp.]
MSTVTRSPRTGVRQLDSIIKIPVTMHWLWAPLGLLLTLPVPALIGSLAIPPAQFPALFGQPSFLEERARLVAISYIAIMLVVFLVFVPMRGRAATFISLDTKSITWLNRTVLTLASVTFAAYVFWIGSAVTRGLGPSAVLDLLTGEEGTIFVLRNQYFENYGGLTTWMQLAALLAPLVILRAKATGRAARTYLVPLFVLAFVRALLNSERLALIELALSTILAYLILRDEAPRIVRTAPRAIALIIGAWLALIVVFGTFEYFRSWTYAEAGYDGDFWSYAITLLLGYYATALNLAAFDSSILDGTPLVSAMFQGNLYEQFFGPSPLAGVQRAYGLETFTNRSGLLVPDIALGAWGGAVVIALTAFAIATLARRTARGDIIAFAAYCASAVAVLEIVRIFYLGSSRFLPVLIAIMGMAVSWSLLQAKERGARKSTRRRSEARSRR